MPKRRNRKQTAKPAAARAVVGAVRSYVLEKTKVRFFSGFGVWFGENDARNITGEVNGRQTAERAEMVAILRTLELADKEQLFPIEIVTANCTSEQFMSHSVAGKGTENVHQTIAEMLQKTGVDGVRFVRPSAETAAAVRIAEQMAKAASEGAAESAKERDAPVPKVPDSEKCGAEFCTCGYCDSSPGEEDIYDSLWPS